jgi:hypothetical protein
VTKEKSQKGLDILPKGILFLTNLQNVMVHQHFAKIKTGAAYPELTKSTTQPVPLNIQQEVTPASLGLRYTKR